MEMKKDGTKYLALVQFPTNKEPEWMVLHWGKPPAFFDVHRKEQWLNGFLPPKIKKILKYHELSDVLKRMEMNWYYEIEIGDHLDYYKDDPNIHCVWIVEKSFWDEHKYFDDQHISNSVTLPFENNECQESLFEFYCSVEEAERLLQENGFMKLDRNKK